MKSYNENIIKVLRLTRKMILLADEGDLNRRDVTCGVLYGMLRDTAYKIKNLAEDEREIHIREGLWDKENN